MSASLLEHVFSLEDPRGERNQRHALLDIVLLGDGQYLGVSQPPGVGLGGDILLGQG